MGQISLPRTEKLGVSMCWESTLLFNEERWAGIKTHMIARWLCKYMFIYHFRYKKILWKKDNNRHLMTNFFKNSKLNLKFTELLKKKHKSLLGHYIYQMDGKYVTLVVYSSKFKTQPGITNINQKSLLDKTIKTNLSLFYKYKLNVTKSTILL